MMRSKKARTKMSWWLWTDSFSCLRRILPQWKSLSKSQMTKSNKSLKMRMPLKTKITETKNHRKARTLLKSFRKIWFRSWLVTRRVGWILNKNRSILTLNWSNKTHWALAIEARRSKTTPNQMLKIHLTLIIRIVAQRRASQLIAFKSYTRW